MSSFELPTLTHLGHGSSTPTRSSSNEHKFPDLIATSATMGMTSSSSKNATQPVTGLEAQEAPMDSPVISREAGERDPLLLRGKIVPEGEINEMRQ